MDGDLGIFRIFILRIGLSLVSFFREGVFFFVS